jgi:hypothetical protein
MALVRPKGLLLHGETASFDAASSQSNQRSFQLRLGRQTVGKSDRSLWPDLLISTAESLPAMLLRGDRFHQAHT